MKPPSEVIRRISCAAAPGDISADATGEPAGPPVAPGLDRGEAPGEPVTPPVQATRSGSRSSLTKARGTAPGTRMAIGSPCTRKSFLARRRSGGSGSLAGPLGPLDPGTPPPHSRTGRPPSPYRSAMSHTYRVPGAVLTEREHRVPLDHAKASGPSLTVFSREVADPDGLARPYLLFLQGGPGFEATRPTSPPSGWMKRALEDYRVLLLDQRGTGRSTPVGSLIPGETPEAQATYLTHFRADSIVRDAELIRRELEVDRWSVLGQSFGGFSSLTYLSIAPDGLREASRPSGQGPGQCPTRSDTSAFSPPSTSSQGCGRTTGSPSRTAPQPTSSPNIPGPGCTAPTSSRTTKCRSPRPSTRTTSMSSAGS